MSANADLYLFDGEVIDQVVVVFVEAAVQRHTVRVEEQILRKRKKEPLNPNPNRNVEPGPDDSYCYFSTRWHLSFSTHSGHSTIALNAYLSRRIVEKAFSSAKRIGDKGFVSL